MEVEIEGRQRKVERQNDELIFTSNHPEDYFRLHTHFKNVFEQESNQRKKNTLDFFLKITSL